MNGNSAGDTTTPEPDPVSASGAAGQAGTGPTGGERLHGCPVTDAVGTRIVHCNREAYLGLCRGLKADGYAMPVGVTGVDYLTHPGRQLPEGIRAERFEVVVELLDLVNKSRIRVRCQVPAADPRMPSLYELWPGTDFHERETYDMFGIAFDGHPDLSRILMPEDWEGHPLRKDYDTGHVPVQFKEAPRGATI
jgi:NADH-quinone oxidoreductase subunit C